MAWRGRRLTTHQARARHLGVEQPADEGADLVLVERAVVEEEERGVPALLRLLGLVPVAGHDAVADLRLGRVLRLPMVVGGWTGSVDCGSINDQRKRA